MQKKSRLPISANSHTHIRTCVYLLQCVCFGFFVYGKCYCLTLNFATCLSSVRKRRSMRVRERRREGMGQCVCARGRRAACVCFGPKLMTDPNNIIKFNALIFHGPKQSHRQRHGTHTQVYSPFSTPPTHSPLPHTTQINHKYKFYHFIFARLF